MKAFAVLVLIVAVSANLSTSGFGQGQSCNSNGGFNIQSVNIYPWPPVAYQPQLVQVNGTFSGNYCPNQVHIHEVYNLDRSYDQQIYIDQCYTNGQQVTFNWHVNPFFNFPGNYQIYLYLQTERPQSALACWTYSYTLN